MSAARLKRRLRQSPPPATGRGRIAYLDLDRRETGGPDWRPVDAYLRINFQGRSFGTGWFRFAADAVTCESIDPDGKRQHHRLAHTGPVPAFGAHPILNDGFWTALFDLSRPREVQRLANSITYSKEMIGKETWAQMPNTFELAELAVK